MNDQLVAQLKRHEGKKLKPYRCTAGKVSYEPLDFPLTHLLMVF